MYVCLYIYIYTEGVLPGMYIYIYMYVVRIATYIHIYIYICERVAFVLWRIKASNTFVDSRSIPEEHGLSGTPSQVPCEWEGKRPKVSLLVSLVLHLAGGLCLSAIWEGTF